MSWQFNKIPESDYPKLETALSGHDLGAIILLHDKYEVSNIQMCCCEKELKTELYNEIEFWYSRIKT